MQGRRFCRAISCARRCFFTVIGKYVPPLTVASFATTTHSRPSTTPMPVTMPAAGGCPPYMSHAARAVSSRKALSGSTSRSIRSRAVSFPRARCRSSARSSPPRVTSAVRSRSSATSASMRSRRLAETRVSKEYISQIETGKTRPTSQTLEWLAERLGVDTHYLADGVSDRDHREHEAIVCQAEEAVQEKRYGDAVDLVAGLSRAPGSPELRLRALFAESWARMYLGELKPALDRLERARAVAAADAFGDVHRAEVLYRLACCRYKLNHVEQALEDFSAALELADRSGESCDRLRANILQWRSRCYRRHRDCEAAREDIERALELAEAASDEETVAHTHFQASLVAERNGSWAQARTYSERAIEIYEAVDDPVNVGRLLNNLGILNFLLGHKEQAVEQLKDAFRIALEVGDPADSAQAVSSLADVHLRSGELELAERPARHAIEMLDGRVDYLYEIGMATS